MSDILAQKYYKDHLKNKHPSENCLDLTPFGQSKINRFFSPKMPISVPPDKDPVEASDVQGAGHSGEGGHVRVEPGDIVVDELHLSLLGKRRHQSGDSEINDDKDMETDTDRAPSPKKVHIENVDQDNKIDKILSEIKALRSDLKVSAKNQPSESDVNRNEIKAVEPEESQVLNLLFHARSIEDLKRIGFKYDGEYVICRVCDTTPGSSGSSGIFAYSEASGVEFEDEFLLPPEFSNLKKSIKRHIQISQSHSNSVKSELEKEIAANNLISKNRAAGLNLGFICMKNYILGRPYTDYETDVQLLKKSGHCGQPQP